MSIHPFDLEHCTNCNESIRDSDSIELVRGNQEIKQWCENCGWKSVYVYELKFVGEKQFIE